VPCYVIGSGLCAVVVTRLQTRRDLRSVNHYDIALNIGQANEAVTVQTSSKFLTLFTEYFADIMNINRVYRLVTFWANFCGFHRFHSRDSSVSTAAKLWGA
jgi:hypothetical protein